MRKILSVFFVFSLLCVSAQAEKYYVTPDGSDTKIENWGLSWDSPMSLNAALTNTSLQDGDEIFVKKGTYIAPENSSFTSNKAAVNIYGNCEGNETVKPVSYDLSDIKTYLKGNGRRVLYFKTASTFIGFDISGGDAYNSTAGGSGRGGGVYIDDAGGTIEHCIIHDNIGVGPLGTASGVGGGVYSIGIVKDCIIEKNVGTGNDTNKRGVGGGIRMGGGFLINSIIRNNKAVSADNIAAGQNVGGGVSATSGYIVNCLIDGNSTGGSENNANYGGGIDFSMATAPTGPETASVFVINCTVVNNTVSGRGGGIGGANVSYLQATNCIFANNTARATALESNNVYLGVGTSVIKNSLWAEAEIANGNLNSDPQFTDAVGKDFTLQATSPALNAGDNTAIAGYSTDLGGKARIYESIVDMGAYEADVMAVSIEETALDNESVIEKSYYTLDGLRIGEPDVEGVYIVKKTYDSGRTEAVKFVFRK